MRFLSRLQSDFSFVVLILIFSFLLYFFFLSSHVTYFGVFTFDLFIFSMYFWRRQDVYRSKYYAPFFVANGVKGSILSHKFISVFDLVPGHVLIFLGGYYDDFFGEVRGSEGVVLIDKSYLVFYHGGNVGVQPGVYLRHARISDESRFSDLRRVILRYGGNTENFMFAVPQDFSMVLSSGKTLSFLNLSNYFESQSQSVELYKNTLNSLGVSIENYIQTASSVLEEKNLISRLRSTKKPFFREKDEEEE